MTSNICWIKSEASQAISKISARAGKNYRNIAYCTATEHPLTLFKISCKLRYGQKDKDVDYSNKLSFWLSCYTVQTQERSSLLTSPWTREVCSFLTGTEITFLTPIMILSKVGCCLSCVGSHFCLVQKVKWIPQLCGRWCSPSGRSGCPQFSAGLRAGQPAIGNSAAPVVPNSPPKHTSLTEWPQLG